MYQLILIIHVLVAAFLVGLVLMQQGKGASIGAAFGSGASQTVFGSRGSGSFLMRLTISLAVVFFSTSIALNYLASRAVRQQQVIDLPAQTQETDLPSTVSPNSIPASTPAVPAQTGKS